MVTHTQASAVDTLWIGHWPYPIRCEGPPAGDDAFVVDTCLRRLMIGASEATMRRWSAVPPPEHYAGVAGYRFLLEVATGLKSAIAGETNVFGQIRRAWEAHRQAARPASLAALAPLMTRLITDTRAIRREHLQGIGGASYGALVRRLLAPADGANVLLVGAGELARTMLGCFHNQEVGVWNRSRPGPGFARAARRFAPDEADAAARWAHHVVIATPADPGNDALWMERLASGPARSAVHLGHRDTEPLDWPAFLLGYDLDDIFELRRQRENTRSLQLERARHACRERALQLWQPGHTAAQRLAAG